MTWFFVALLASVLWSVSTHIDKYVINKYFKVDGVGSLVIFSGISGVVISIAIFLFTPVFTISPWYALVIILNGALLVGSFIPYFYALNEGETSTVVPLYQAVPVFGFILGYIFLGEKLSLFQIVAGALIVIGAIGISLEIEEKISLKKKVFFLMMLSSLMVAINILVFKLVALEENFWVTSFWEDIGAILFGLSFFTFVPTYRKQFIYVLRHNTYPILGLNIFNEMINIGAKLLSGFAALLAPIALVLFVNGFQPFFVFIYGIFLTLFFPHISKENIQKKYLAQKILSILIIFIGTYILFNNQGF